MSDNLSSLNVTLLAQFLQSSRAARLQLEPQQSSLQTLNTSVASRCAAPNLGNINSIPDAKTLLDAWLQNDEGAQAIHDDVAPFAGPGGGNVTVPDSVAGETFESSGASTAELIESEPAELVGFPPNSGFVDDPVCAANGNFLHGDQDFSTQGFGSLIDTVRLYNSMAAYRRGLFGWGWSSVLDMHVRPADETGVVRVTLADGAITGFAPDGDGGFKLDGRRRLKLERTDTGSTLSHGRDEAWFFDGDGELTGGRSGLASFAIRHGSRRITVNEGRSGRSVVYILDADGLVTSARTGDGRSVTYEYLDGHLVAARRAIGDVTYEIADGFIESIFDADGVLFCRNTYDDAAAGRVLTQLSAHGRTTVYRYGDDGVTVVGDIDDGPEATFKHDIRGNLVAMSGGLGAEARMAWDSYDRITNHVDRTGNETRYVYHPDASLDLLMARIDPDGLGELRDFDDFGRLIHQVGRNGEVHKFVYDSDDSHTPSLIIGPEGGRVATTFGADGLPATITDADGVVSEFMFDADGQLVATLNGAGDRTVFVYDKVGRLAKVTDPLGKTVTFDHEDSGRVDKVTSVDGIVHQYVNSSAGRVLACMTDGPGSWTATYGDHGELSTFADAVGSTVGYDYDTHGSLISITAPDGAIYRQEYDAELNLVAKTDSAGNRATQEYDAAGRSIKTVTSDGETWTRTVDSMGRTATLTALDGSTSRWAYHPNGELSTYTSPVGDVWRYEIDLMGRVVAETDPTGAVSSYAYTPAGRLRSFVTAAGRTHDYSYDAAGRLVKISDADGVDVTSEFRSDGHVDRLTNPESSVSFTYDDAGRITGWANGSDPDAATLDWEPNAMGFAAANTSVAMFERDPRGLLSSATDAAGVTTAFERDLRGRITGTVTTTSEQEASTAVTFDPSGATATVTDPLGVTTLMSNTASGRPMSVTIGSAEDNIGWSYAYDEMRRVTAITSADGDELVSYAWDEMGYKVGATNEHGSVSIERDAFGRISAVGHLEDRETRYIRDADGLVAGRTTPTSATRFVRSDAGRLLGFADSDAGLVALPDLSDDPVLKTAAGRILGDRHGRVYSYDDAGRLAEAVSADGGRHAFTYNDFGFVATDTTPRYGRRRFTYNIGGQLETVLAEDGSASEFSYDAAGRRTAELHADGSRVRYHWNDLNQLTRITRVAADGSESARTVMYSGLDRPERVDDTDIGWDDGLTGKPIQIGDQRYLRSGTMVRAAVPDAPWFDGTTDDPWGDSNHAGIGLGFNGELAVDNLIFMGARVYDPATRTFLSRDPLPSVAGANTYNGGYAFAWNDPINYLDPSGLQPVSRDGFDEYKADQERSAWGSLHKPFSDDPWGTLAMVAVVAVGVALVATGVGAGVGAGILIGAAVSAGMGAATGTFNPRSVAISGAFGAIPGTQSLTVGRAVAAGAMSGAAQNVSEQVLVQGRGFSEIDPRSVAISGVFSAVPGGRLSPGRQAMTATATGAGENLADQVIVQGRGLNELDVRSIAVSGAAGGITTTAELGFDHYMANRSTGGAPAPDGATTTHNADIETEQLVFPGMEAPPQAITPQLVMPPAMQPAPLALPAGRTNPWPVGDNGVSMPAPAGMTIQMAMSPGQTDPGGFGTLDHIPDVDFVRNDLAVIPDWKPEVSHVQTFEIPEGTQVQVGPVGPQEFDGVIYPGGANQVEILNGGDRNKLIPVGPERPIN